MSQEELGKKLGKALSAISQYERGKHEPGIDTLQKLSTLFDVTIDQLVNQDLSAGERTSIPYGIETHLHKLEDSQQPYGTKDRVMFITDITASGGQLSGHSDGSTNGVWVSVPNAKPQSIALTVVGDSMAPIINEGDVVIGEPIALEDMRPGDIYIDEVNSIFLLSSSFTSLKSINCFKMDSTMRSISFCIFSITVFTKGDSRFIAQEDSKESSRWQHMVD